MNAVHFVHSYNDTLLDTAGSFVCWLLVIVLLSVLAVGWSRAMQEIGKHGHLFLLAAAALLAILLAFFKVHAKIVFY